MKKYLILMLAAAAALVSCGKETLAPEVEVPENVNESVQATPITFNLSANHPDATKAVKEDWQDGDAIFVFFTGAAAPKHLKMTFDGSSWTSAEYDGASLTAGALGLKNGDSGTMRAVFLPFGSDATVSASGTSFIFSTTYYAYYLTATLDYTVSDNEVSGAFNMEIPDDYVQFFIEDAAATDGAYTLGTDAVIPVGVASIAADGTITDTSDKAAGNDMIGYAYQDGYLFSGKLTSWAFGSNYYFAKTKTADNTRADYFVNGKTLASHSAVKLPANSSVINLAGTSGKWVPVGSGLKVNMGNVNVDEYMAESLGKWQTCNEGATKPEQVGTLYTFDQATALDGVYIASKYTFDRMLAQLSWTWLSVNGKQGVVVKAKDTNGFIFLPAQYDTDYDRSSEYWTSTESTEAFAYELEYWISENQYATWSVNKNGTNPVRAFTN
ncbi:MAG: hypothetical protein IJ623_04300 [Bacteroidales bacterium]|nr:hypothetical protein [Bacteroidales bacterium]